MASKGKAKPEPTAEATDPPLRVFGAEGDAITLLGGQTFHLARLRARGTMAVRDWITNHYPEAAVIDAPTIGGMFVGGALTTGNFFPLSDLLRQIVAEPLPERDSPGLDSEPAEMTAAIDLWFTTTSGLGFLSDILKKSAARTTHGLRLGAEMLISRASEGLDAAIEAKVSELLTPASVPAGSAAG